MRFLDREHFVPEGSYRLLPFRFLRLDDTRYVVTNDVGEHVVLSRQDLDAYAHRRLGRSTEAYRALKSRHFLFDAGEDSALDLLALKARTRAEPIAELTGLHIFVVTLRCDHSCHYCQVSRQTEDREAFDMSRDHADRALALTFASPSKSIKIEFQGGEPLLNFELVRYVVERAEALARERDRNVQFVVASNLARLTDEILAFAKVHGVLFSTSLDGPPDLHDRHRAVRGGSSHAMAVAGIDRVREALGPGAISALMTTTPASLDRVEAIVDEYVQRGLDSIFLRSLSPYGFAVRSSLVRRYDARDWLRFYERGLSHILELNRRGLRFREELTAILLQKCFTPAGSSYVDLQSPAGLGIGALVYNYDGAVFASDEGRMLAEMGDTSLRLGHVDTDDYATLLTSDTLLGALEDSLPESSPMCADCAFVPYCGADPAYHQATQRDLVGHKALSGFCTKQMGIMRHLIRLLEDDRGAREILLGWL